MKSYLITLIGLLTISLGSFAQNSSNKGTEFWVGFMAHYSSNADMYLYITSDSSTSGTVSIPGQSWSKTFTVTANQMTLVAVPTSTAYVGCSDCIEKRGIKVESDKNVVVYAHIYYQYRSDATLVLPTKSLGKEYYAIGYDQERTSDRSQFMIAAHQNSTRVKITPSCDIRSSSNGRLTAGTSYYVTLNSGEVYQGRAFSGNKADDVTGTHIEVIDTGKNANCRTVAVFAGSSWTTLGCTSGFASGDNLYEQMYPVNSWGSKFIVVPLAGVSGSMVRLLASEDNTSILVYHVSGAPTQVTLNAGKEYTFNCTESKYILAGKPITVAQYCKTQACSGGNSDPAMTIINPIEQTLDKITLYSSKYEDIRKHYINVVIPAGAASSFRIDGNSATFTTVPRAAKYAYAQISVAEGNHFLSASEGFIATAYGFGSYESYGYAAGANVKDLTAKIVLANSSVTDDNQICLGTAAKFEGSAEYTVSKYEWDFGDGTIDSVAKTSHIYGDTGTYRVRLYTHKKLFDGCSSFDSSIMKVIVTGKPKAHYVTSLRCEKNTINFTDSSKAPYKERIQSSVWSFHKGSDQYGPTAKLYYDSSGTYYARLIVRTENQCYDTMIDSIVVNPLPVALFTGENSCQFDSTKFTNLSTIKKGTIASNKWYFGDGDSSTLNSPKHFYQDSGKYYVQLNVLSDSLCPASYRDSVYKHGAFKIDFDFEDTCRGMTIDFNNKSTNYGANITGQGWVISTGPADTSDWYNFSKSFDTTGTFKVKYWVEIDGVCRDSLEKPLEIYPLVKTNFTVGNACSNDSVLFTNTSTISKGTASVFSWDVNNGTIYKKDVFKAKYASPGAKNIELVMVSDKGCKSTLKKTVQVREINLKDIVSKDVCVNENQILKVNKTVTFDTISRYSWIVNSTVVSTDSTMSFKQASAGKYKIVLNVTTKNGCLGEVIDTVEVFGLPTAAYTIAPVCVNQDFQTVNTSSAPSTSVISSYQWFVNGTGIGSAMEPAFAASTAGTYNFRLIVTSDKGCKDTTDLAVSANPLPRINFTVSDTCIGEISTLRDASTVSSGSLLGYIWRFADGTNANGQNTTKTFGTLGNHLVKHIVSTDKGCIDSMSKNVSMNPLPVLDISGTDLEGCMPFTPTFVNNSSVSIGSISTYTWFWGDGSSSTGITPTHSYVDQGNYNIKIRATTDKGCRDSMDLSGTVVVHPLPMADFSFTPEKPSILESTITITDLSSTDIVNWNWSMGDGTTYSDQNPIHNFQDTGTYKIVLIATNDKGCSDEASQVLFINPDLFIYIPTSFTPNGDRLNDRFGVSGVKQGIRNYSLAIYNRWGEKIFYSENVDDQWDGTYNGVDVPAGVYFYMMTFSDYKKTRWYYEKGDLSVIR